MRNANFDGDRLTVTAPAAVASGGVVLVGAITGVAVNAAANGAQVVIATRGVFSLAKQASLAVAQGDTVYWDNAAAEVDKTNTNRPLGVAVKAAASGDATVMVKLLAAA
jgi:predicted RecA/RadA family phage recombinase